MTQVWQRRKPDAATTVGWRTVTRKHFTLPSGSEIDFDTIGSVGDHSAAVIALTTDNKVIIAEQFRAGPERIMQELPGGMIDPGEDPVEAAQRELLEETGYSSSDIVALGACHGDAYSNNTHWYFLARNCEKIADQMLEEGEDVTVRIISIPELIKNAQTAQMTDAVAVLYAYEELQQLIVQK